MNVRYVYIITGKGERKFWTKVGVAFTNRDGSLNVKLESLPTNGEFHIRPYVSKEEATKALPDDDDIPF